MKTLLITTMIWITAGCGAQIEIPEEKTFNQEDVQKEKSSNEDEQSLVSYEPIYLRGSVSSGFTISVDGQNYDDSEDFYTQQLDVLEAEKIENGYEDYELTFDAALGLNDLKNGMTVYAESDGETGYSGETIVSNNGTFEIQFPAKADGERLNVRANKRIGIILKGPENELIYWCYNFSATTETTIGPDNKPVILRHFNTKLTKYKCSGRRNNPLSIPQNPSFADGNSGNVDDGKAPTQEQIEEWDRQWEEEVVLDNNDGE